MGHHSSNKPFLETDSSTINRSSEFDHVSVGTPDQRKHIKMDQSQKASFLPEEPTKTNYLLENCWVSTKGITLLFNIGPTFFHLLSMNICKKRCFNYLFDFTKGKGCVKNKFEPTALNGPLQTSHEFPTVYSRPNCDIRSLISVNVYSDKCICEKCLVTSYLFSGTQANDLRCEFLRILSSDHCRNWDDNWITLLIEQTNIFFCCIKDGVIYERLLEPASLCAKMLFIKTQMKHVIEFKYGYIFFHLNLLRNACLSKYVERKIENMNEKKLVTNNSGNLSKQVSFLDSDMEGREIRKLRILSFKTEANMKQCADIVLRYVHGINRPPVDRRYDGIEIVPTKTDDVTKIKGWRNKLFSFTGPPNDHKCEGLQRIVDGNEVKLIEKLSQVNIPLERSKKKTDNFFENANGSFKKKVDKYREDTEKQNFVNALLCAATEEQNLETENLENFADEKDEIGSDKGDKTGENGNGAKNQNEGVSKLQIKQEQKAIFFDLPQQAVQQLEGKKKGVFESEVLDEFLKKNSELNINYDIPTLQAAVELSNCKKSEKKNYITTLKTKDETLGDEIKTEQKISTKLSKEYNDEQKISDKFIRFKTKLSNPTLRYIWVQGRPIEVISEEKEVETLMFLKNKRYSPFAKTCFKKLRDSQFQFDTSDNISRFHFKVEQRYSSENQRPRLLTDTGDEELDAAPKECDFPSNVGPRFIPIVHGCAILSDRANNRRCCCKSFSLCMVLTIGRGRNLSKEAVENLEALSSKDNEINERMATIAACAFTAGRNKKIRRVIVPVVSSTVLNSVKNWEERLAYDKIALNVPSPSAGCDIDQEVKEVVNQIVEYAVRKLDPVQILYDPTDNRFPESSVKTKQGELFQIETKKEQDLSESINDSNTIKRQELGSKCGNDFCEKGCVCLSLNNKINFPLHCGKMSCIFYCSCPNRQLYEQNVFKADLGVTFMRKEETHQKVFASKFCSPLEIKAFVDKSKREKKLPTRYRNNVLLGKEMFAPIAPSAICPRAPILFPKLQTCVEEGKAVPKGESQKKQTMKRRFGFCAGIIKGRQSLADVFIWCGVHDRYNCLCVSWIGRLNENALIWKPERNVRYLPHKLMTEMELSQDFSFEVFLFDNRQFCARTYGAPVEYAVRNRSEIFIAKRKCELENGIISCTNSYVKMKFFMVKDKEIEEENQSKKKTESKEECKSSPVENVYIKPVCSYEEGMEEVEITDNFAPVNAEHVIVEPDTDSENDFVEAASDEIMVSPTVPVKSEKPKNEISLNKDVTKSAIIVPESPLMNLLKAPTLYHSKTNKTFDEKSGSHKELISESTLHSSTKVEISEKRKRSISDNHAFNNCNQTVRNISEFEKTTSKKKKIFEQSVDLVIKDKTDTRLESALIRLEEHPLKNQMYGPDNLPHLALVCLTPGIGYLPILEFHPEILAVQDPVSTELFHSFKNLESANVWLNRFFKNRLIFETIDTSLKWVIAKPGVIKLKKISPFCPKLLENPSIIVSTNGGLIFKKKDVQTGGTSKVAVKVAPLSLTGGSNQQVSIVGHAENKRKVIHLSTETIVDICDGDGKRRKIQLDTLPISKYQMVKRPVNLLCKYSTLKVKESLIGNPVSAPASAQEFASRKSTCNVVSPFISVCVDDGDGKVYTKNQYVSPRVIKPSVRSFIVSNSSPTPLRLKINPSRTSSSTNNSVKSSFSPPPLLYRSSVPLTGSKIVSCDSRPITVSHNNTLPINVKEW